MYRDNCVYSNYNKISKDNVEYGKIIFGKMYYKVKQ